MTIDGIKPQPGDILYWHNSSIRNRLYTIYFLSYYTSNLALVTTKSGTQLTFNFNILWASEYTAHLTIKCNPLLQDDSLYNPKRPKRICL